MDTRRARWFARLYDRFSARAERRWTAQRRRRLVGDLTGRVLEVGAGTGANLPHYRRASEVVATEPSAAMRAQLKHKRDTASVPLNITDAPAEELPFPEGSFDVVVCILVLCSVSDVDHALAEAHRVLKPSGQLVFLEHVRDEGLRGWLQDRLERPWQRLAAGCLPNRRTLDAVRGAGFSVSELEIFRAPSRMPLCSPFALGAATIPK